MEKYLRLLIKYLRCMRIDNLLYSTNKFISMQLLVIFFYLLDFEISLL